MPNYTVNITPDLPLAYNFYGFPFYLSSICQWYIKLGYLIDINVNLPRLSLLTFFLIFFIMIKKK